MNISITKEDFERSLPVGMSAHSSVYEAVAPQLGIEEEVLRQRLLGEAGMSRLEELGDGSMLLRFYKQLASLEALLAVLRQLDLVLTPTGFGVVSNDNVAPASQQRVDALEAQLRSQRLRTLGRLTEGLRSKAWGRTLQAVRALPYLYDLYTFILSHAQASEEEWERFRMKIAGADELVRSKISDAQMDEVLDAYRQDDAARLTAYLPLINMIVSLTDSFAVAGPGVTRMPVYRRLMRTIDADEAAQTFSLYRGSANFKANHYEAYRNSRDAKGYLFNG